MDDFKHVTVMTFGGKTKEMVVVKDLGDVLVLTKPEEWEQAKRDKREPIAVGFKKSYLVDVTVNINK
jgi:hypothetical protein